MPSPGPKAGLASPSDGESTDDEWPSNNGLRVQTPPRGFDKIYDYEKGGHHPVHLGDIPHERYKILYKLGSGGFANVWLCSDISVGRPRDVALKIMAEVSTPECPKFWVSELVDGRGLSDELFCLPLDRFEIEGPNGLHYLLSILFLGQAWDAFPGKTLSTGRLHTQEICSQVVRAMAVLHEHGICHRDFRPANILTRLSGLDELSEDKLVTIMGNPGTVQVTTRDGEPHSLSSAPQYLVCPESSETGARMITYQACVTDFGESYQVSLPPLDLGIPMAYCAPEYDLEKKTGISNDLWALGCTLFEIRAGRSYSICLRRM